MTRTVTYECVGWSEAHRHWVYGVRGMSDVVEFLRARLDEDEKWARWLAHEPSRTRANRDIAAKREILDHHVHWQRTLDYTPGGWTENATTAYRMAMEWTVAQLASAYAGHPDFD